MSSMQPVCVVWHAQVILTPEQRPIRHLQSWEDGAILLWDRWNTPGCCSEGPLGLDVDDFAVGMARPQETSGFVHVHCHSRQDSTSQTTDAPA